MRVKINNFNFNFNGAIEYTESPQPKQVTPNKTTANKEAPPTPPCRTTSRGKSTMQSYMQGPASLSHLSQIWSYHSRVGRGYRYYLLRFTRSSFTGVGSLTGVAGVGDFRTTKSSSASELLLRLLCCPLTNECFRFWPRRDEELDVVVPRFDC